MSQLLQLLQLLHSSIIIPNWIKTIWIFLTKFHVENYLVLIYIASSSKQCKLNTQQKAAGSKIDISVTVIYFSTVNLFNFRKQSINSININLNKNQKDQFPESLSFWCFVTLSCVLLLSQAYWFQQLLFFIDEKLS